MFSVAGSSQAHTSHRHVFCVWICPGTHFSQTCFLCLDLPRHTLLTDMSSVSGSAQAHTSHRHVFCVWICPGAHFSQTCVLCLDLPRRTLLTDMFSVSGSAQAHTSHRHVLCLDLPRRTLLTDMFPVRAPLDENKFNINFLFLFNKTILNLTDGNVTKNAVMLGFVISFSNINWCHSSYLHII